MTPDAIWKAALQSANDAPAEHSPMLEAVIDAIAGALTRTRDFTPEGREQLENQLINDLAGRLRINSVASPDAPVAPALFVIGPTRTGTTLLQHLLARDPHARSLVQWESDWPIPAPTRATYDTDPRWQRSAEHMRMMREKVPALFEMHPMSETLPSEDSAILNRCFLAGNWKGMILDKEFEDWVFANSDEIATMAYRHHRLELAYLQSDFQFKHWVLKAPAHSFGIPPLLDIYPEATVLYTYREPADWMASQFRAQWLFRSMMSDTDKQELAQSSISWWSRAMDNMIESLRQRPDRFITVDFRRMVYEPVETIREIYDRRGMEYSNEFDVGMEDFLKNDRFVENKSYTTSLEEFGVTREEINERFHNYRKEFGLA